MAIANKITKNPYNNLEKDRIHLDSLLSIMQADAFQSSKNTQPIILQPFDPNFASKEKLLQVGFPNWLATQLINFRKAGGSFKKKKDLLKLYNFPDSLYENLADYIYVKSSIKPKRNWNTRKTTIQARSPASIRSDVDYNNAWHKQKEYKLPVFNLNTADTAVFQTIKGIGSKLSNRIVAYRSALGGFISKNQLYEIYRLDTAVVEKLSNMSVITSGFVPVKLEINNYTKEQLASHPYINWSQAKLIIAYRNQHGSFDSLQNLLQVYSINQNWIKKNASYLTFQKGSP